VNHAIRLFCSAAQAFQVFNIAAMHLGTSSGKRLGSRIRASNAKHLMARGDQFFDNSRAYESSGAGEEDPHEEFSGLDQGHYQRSIYPGKLVTLYGYIA
jgi:hypothetical protein